MFLLFQQNHVHHGRYSEVVGTDRTNLRNFMPNIFPRSQENNSNSKEPSTENSPSSTPTHQPNDADTKSSGVLSPQRPINLLPEVPTQTSRRLSEREQRDCDVIGKTKMF